MIFPLEWLTYYIAAMFMMCFDNLTWIPADYKWYGTKEWRPYFKVFLTLGKREFIYPNTKEGFKICLSRIKAVLTHIYDIIPAIFYSLILAVIF